MKQLLLALALMCVATTSAFAGEIPSVGAPVPPPAAPPSGITSEVSWGDMPISDLTDQISSGALSALLTSFDLMMF
ncbi:MAG TPA: hypothetical protein VLL54_07280 [Pyrinomonadaceae bacterium]|nr:hypothetical protein [Pyrinomonadaceae bacterium]